MANDPSPEAIEQARRVCDAMRTHETHKEDSGQPPRGVPTEHCANCHRIAAALDAAMERQRERDAEVCDRMTEKLGEQLRHAVELNSHPERLTGASLGVSECARRIRNGGPEVGYDNGEHLRAALRHISRTSSDPDAAQFAFRAAEEPPSAFAPQDDYTDE